ncbi:MAG: hypothetical protein K5911_04180 [Eubacteriales bacterium]|nr:hypothetical protein [Eubacteriales bacterium]
MDVRVSLVAEKLREFSRDVRVCLAGDPYISSVRYDPLSDTVSLMSVSSGDGLDTADVYIFTEDPRDDDCDCIVVGDLAVGRIYSVVDSCLRTLSDWEVSLARAACEDRGVNDILNLSRDIFNCPITVYDNSMRLVGYTNLEEKDLSGYYVNISGQWYISESNWNNSKTVDIPLISKNPAHPIVFHDTLTDLDVTECPVRYSGQMIGFVTLPHAGRPLLRCHDDLIELLCRYLGYAMWRELNRDSRYALESVFPYELILNRRADPLLAEHFMNILGWKKGDTYQLIVVEPMLDEGGRRGMSSLFKEAVMGTVNGNTAVIMHGSGIREGDELTAQLSILMEKENAGAGVSMIYDDLSSSAEHYLQAIHSCSARKGRVTFYEEHMHEHVLEEFGRDHDMEEYIHPFIRKMEKADPSGILRTTLYEYILSGRRYTQTAGALCIQKASLKYRLDKIRDMDPSESYLEKNVRMDMLLSLRMSLKDTGESSL